MLCALMSGLDALNIVGTPKSGTSSLFYWLNAHPELNGAHPKETFFFMDQDHPLASRHGVGFHTNGVSAYDHFFADATDGQKRFEGTTHYFYQETARKYLAGLNPQPLIVFVLREPAARIQSSFRFTRDNLANCSPQFTFDEFVDCLTTNSLSRLDSEYTSASSLFLAKQELQLSNYVHWIRWWNEVFPRDSIEIVLFEELYTDPVVVMRRLCHKLAVDPTFFDDFEFQHYNPTLKIRHHRLHRQAIKFARFLPSSNIKKLAKTLYLRFQKSSSKPQSNDVMGLTRLTEYFRSANEDLANEYVPELFKWWKTESIPSKA